MDFGVLTTTCEEVCLWSIGTSPFRVNGERAEGRTVGKLDGLCLPIYLGIMLSQPRISKDKIVMTEVADVEGNDFMMSICFHGEKNFVSDFAFDVDQIIGISNDEGSTEFLLFHLISFDEFPMDEAGIGSTVNESVLCDAMLSLS